MQNAHLNVTCIQKKKTIIIINHKHDLPNFFFFHLNYRMAVKYHKAF